MSRRHRLVKPFIAFLAAGAVVLAVSGCAFVKPGSLALSQPQGIGPVRVHFVLCTVGGGAICGPVEEPGTTQYLVGIAVPPGSVPPATFTATPTGGGAPIVFTRNEEVPPQLAASSASLQKFIAEFKPETPEEVEELEEFKRLLGGPWPPSGLQVFGYLSAPSTGATGETAEWSVDADFGLPSPAGGGPFAGPFATAIAFGSRIVDGTKPANRPVHCLRFEKGGEEPTSSDAACTGALQQVQLGTADLKIAAPAKTGQAFVGGSGQLTFPLKFAGAPPAPPTFALSATTSLKGGKAKLGSASFTPGPPNPTAKVTVSAPKKTKPGTYSVTLTATTPQGATVTQTSKLKVTKPKLKFGGVQLNTAKGTATLKVKVPGGGSLTVAGKGVAKVKKKAKKAKTLKMKVASTGSASATLSKTGKVKVKVKATFKPTSGISVSKTKSIVLKLG